MSGGDIMGTVDMKNVMHTGKSGTGIHVVAKPLGPACNLSCEYCFYLEKKALFSEEESFRMPDKVLSRFIRDYITSQPTPVVEFVWQGGEPTLAGLNFFRKVVQEQKPFLKKEDSQKLPADQRNPPDGRMDRFRCNRNGGYVHRHGDQ